jgi:hypothetical protein
LGVFPSENTLFSGSVLISSVPGSISF